MYKFAIYGVGVVLLVAAVAITIVNKSGKSSVAEVANAPAAANVEMPRATDQPADMSAAKKPRTIAPQPLAAEKPADSATAKLKAAGYSDKEIEAHKRRLALRSAATARFNETVKMDNLNPGEVKPEVRQMFRTLRLSPDYDVAEGEPGFVNGMFISELQQNNPLSKAGFKRGDKLVSFDGMPLQDPAEIAHLFVDLGSQFEVCADRVGERLCRIVTL